MPKKKSTKKPSVKVNDLRARKNPKGGRASVSDISIQKTVDKTTPVLFQSSTAIKIK